MSSLRERILNAKPQIKQVSVEGIGDCFVRSLSCRTVNKLGRLEDDDERAYRFFCAGVCTENGSQVFDYDQDKDELEEVQLVHLKKLVEQIVQFSTGTQISEAKKN